MNCEFCQSPVHIWFQCPKKPDGWRPARLAKHKRAQPDETLRRIEAGSVVEPSAKSTASRKDANVKAGNRTAFVDGLPTSESLEPGAVAGTQALPVDTNSEPQLIAASNPQRLVSVTRKDTGVVALKPKRGRPSTGFDKRAYNRQYMADRRAGKR